MWHRRARACVGLVASLLMAAPALAGNDEELPVGSRAAMLGGAVTATVQDASATWYNAAGLAAIDGNSVDVSGSAYTLRYYAGNDFIRSADGASADEDLTEFVSVPTLIGFALRLDEDLQLSLGYFAPRATDFVLRTSLQDDEDDWSVAVTLKNVRHAAGGALGFRLSPQLRLGIGLIGHYETQLEAGSVFGVARAMGMNRRVAQVGFVHTADFFNLEAVAGLQWDFAPWITLAIAARSPQVMAVGGSTSTVQLSFVDLEAGGSDASLEPSEADLGSGEVVTAGRYTLAAALRSGPWRVALEGDVQPALDNEAAGVERITLWNARAGVLHRLTETTAIGAGLFTDRAPVRLSSGGLLGLAAHYYGASAGLELGNRYTLAETQPRETIEFSTTVAVRYAYSAARTKAIVVDAEADPDGVFSGTPARLRIHEVGLYIGSGVHF